MKEISVIAVPNINLRPQFGPDRCLAGCAAVAAADAL
jgi:hypothetical protein